MMSFNSGGEEQLYNHVFVTPREDILREKDSSFNTKS